jgi:hypothetical protein
MRVQLYRVHIPAMSTLGYGYGYDTASGAKVSFVGEHRSVRDLGEALRSGGGPVEVKVEDWQTLAVEPLDEMAKAQ